MTDEQIQLVLDSFGFQPLLFAQGVEPTHALKFLIDHGVLSASEILEEFFYYDKEYDE
jgi:hypothetical protein